LHKSEKGKELELIEVMSFIDNNHKVSEGIPMAWKNEFMELTYKLQVNNTGKL